jgi:hypothetical protein
MLGKSGNTVWKPLCVAGLVIASLAWPACGRAQDPAQSNGGSVADAARRSREDQKNAPKTKKVYTDDDVSTRPASDASATPAAPAAGADAGATPGDGSKATPAAGTPGATAPGSDANGEKAWRAKFKAQHDKIDRAEKELDVLQREEDKAQVQYYPDPQKALTEGYSRKDINDKDTKIAAKKQEIADLKHGLDDLEDQLRKSGGDPGWDRE